MIAAIAWIGRALLALVRSPTARRVGVEAARQGWQRYQTQRQNNRVQPAPALPAPGNPPVEDPIEDPAQGEEEMAQAPGAGGPPQRWTCPACHQQSRERNPPFCPNCGTPNPAAAQQGQQAPQGGGHAPADPHHAAPADPHAQQAHPPQGRAKRAGDIAKKAACFKLPKLVLDFKLGGEGGEEQGGHDEDHGGDHGH